MIIEAILEFKKEVKQTGAHDWSDRLTIWLMGVIFVFGCITAYKFTNNSPYVCFGAVNPSGEKFSEYGSNYAWSHGSIPTLSINGVIPEDVSGWSRLYNESGIFYYQWIPLILFLMFFSLLLCRQIWHRVCSKSTSYNLNTLITDCDSTSYMDDKEIDCLAMKILKMISRKQQKRSLINKFKCMVQRTIRCLRCSRGSGSSIFQNYIIYKIVTVLTSLAMSMMLFSIFRVDVTVLDSLWTDRSTANYRFPRSVVALIPNVVGTASRNTFVTQCVTSVNMICEKLFPLLMLMFLLLALAHLIGAIHWLVLIGIRRTKNNFVRKCLKETNENIDEGLLDEFIDEYIRCDGVFIMMMMRRNCDQKIVRRLAVKMWHMYLATRLTNVTTVTE